VHVYVDESKAKGYLLAVVIIEPGLSNGIRKRMLKLRMPGQGHIHFVNERHSRRKSILKEILKFNLQILIYRTDKQSQVQARKLCFEALIDDLSALDASVLVIERDQSSQSSDTTLIKQGLVRRGLLRSVEFRFLGKSEEPILWIADAIAWSYSRGKNYRSLITEAVQKVVEVAS
jgi:hypothetical protein